MVNKSTSYQPDWAMKLGGPTMSKAKKKKKVMDYSTMMQGGKKGGKGKGK